MLPSGPPRWPPVALARTRLTGRNGPTVTPTFMAVIICCTATMPCNAAPDTKKFTVRLPLLGWEPPSLCDR